MKINTNKNCNLVIIDDTSYPYRGFEYKDSASIYVVEQGSTEDSFEIIWRELHAHTNSTGELPSGEPYVINLEVPFKADKGYYRVTHFIVPRVERACNVRKYLEIKDFISDTQIDDILDGPPNDLEPRQSVYVGSYFTDGTKMYTLDENGNIKDIDLDSVIKLLLEINPNVVLKDYGISKDQQDFFSMCHLRNCYISLCQKVFNDTAFTRCFTNVNNSQLAYKRDLVWAAMNSIQYYIDSGQYAEAQRLFERVTSGCGLCTSEDTGQSGCGCK